MNAREIIAGCSEFSVGRDLDGTWYASCVGADIGARGNTAAEALEKLGVLIKVEIRLAVEADQQGSAE